MITNAPPKVIFKIQEITKVYRMGEVEVTALNSVNLSLYEGELVVLLGPSGSGKSTLLNIIGGLDIPSSGHVFFHQRDLTHANYNVLTRFRRECVGFIFQFYNLTRFVYAIRGTGDIFPDDQRFGVLWMGREV
ncbi:ATP-binding cassette domain-containing protein [Rivularia sp. UHCC 0363]|uniref:ATP-binding cassette domain-containing protein n=1 Tax=Rivularia sp. UHCC 0363 TaxID=3110244 RepID=UPI002B207530|nr:ATP-binding cassette domain-containing protein [Rivularia sp. UHCC 0363]MEA5597921.1 ATP-binding cassette domain-containing protein [Rivularia sp. UHCC 0363]